jgi:hypothetical protein
MAEPVSDVLFPDGGRRLSVRMLEEELKAVWKETALAERASAGKEPIDRPPVTRAALMTVVAVVAGDAGTRRMTGMIAHLSERTPCRALVVQLDPAGEAAPGAAATPGGAAGGEPLAAFVSAHCHKVGGRQVCSEQITIRSTPDSDPHLSSLVLPLLMPDLPVVLHWPGVATMMAPANADGPHALARGARFLCDLDPYVDQVILDSTLAGDPVAYLSRAAALAERPAGPGMRPIDLNWVRLLPWREALADAVDRCAIDVRTIREARIEAVPGPDGVPAVRPRLLAGWLIERLDAATEGAFRATIVAPERGAGSSGTRSPATDRPSAADPPAIPDPPGRLRRVTLTLAGGDLMSIQVEDGRLAVEHRGGTFRFARPADDEEHLLCRVIERRGSDPWFARAVRAADGSRSPAADGATR